MLADSLEVWSGYGLFSQRIHSLNAEVLLRKMQLNPMTVLLAIHPTDDDFSQISVKAPLHIKTFPKCVVESDSYFTIIHLIHFRKPGDSESRNFNSIHTFHIHEALIDGGFLSLKRILFQDH